MDYGCKKRGRPQKIQPCDLQDSSNDPDGNNCLQESSKIVQNSSNDLHDSSKTVTDTSKNVLESFSMKNSLKGPNLSSGESWKIVQTGCNDLPEASMIIDLQDDSKLPKESSSYHMCHVCDLKVC